jgi:hypothetical protein
LVDLLGGSLKGTVIEPCAGDGNIAKALFDLRYDLEIVQSDIEKECEFQYDATRSRDWGHLIGEWQSSKLGSTTIYQKTQFDWTITNPPFNQALPIIENAWEYSGIGIAFLLPVTWNEPCEDRREWLLNHADNLRYILPVCPRPHFRKGEINPKTGKEYGSANCTVAWYVWRKDWSWSEMGIKSPFQYLAGWR